MYSLDAAYRPLLALLLLATSEAATADDSAIVAREGRAVLQKHCARCHAIEREGPSPFAQAPPFREIYRKFPREELKMRLTEGAVSHYKEMPQIDLTHEEVAAVMVYLAEISLEGSR